MPTMKTRDLQTQATIRPGTWNPETRTIDVVWSTGARGLQADYWGDLYYEELEISGTAVRLGRLNAGAAVLNAHKRHDMRLQIGVVERAWLEGELACATLRFSEREEIADLVKDIADGIIRNLSVGYWVYVYESILSADGSAPVYRAVDWEPYEISFVPVGFDVGAQTRSTDPSAPREVEVRERGAITPTPSPSPAPAAERGHTEESMPHQNQPGNTPNPAPAPQAQPGNEQQRDAGAGAPAPAPSSEQVRAAAAEAERTRAKQIRQLARIAQVGDAIADALVDEGVEVAVAQQRIADAWQQRDAGRGVSAANPQINRDATDTRRQAMRDALALRSDPKLDLPKERLEAAREYRGMNLMKMAEECVEAAGGKTRSLTPREIAGMALNLERSGMHSTSDFPIILGNVAQVSLRRGYENAPRTFLPLVRKVSLSDFKPVTRAQFGGQLALEPVGEGGEFKRGTLKEGKETYQLGTFGKIISISRQVLMNDNLDAFTRVPELYGAAAANLQSDIVWEILTKNQTMGDGKALFHNDHKNIGTPGVISKATLSEGRKMMRTQKGLDKELINIAPRYLLVPAELETDAETFLATVLATKNDDVNVFAGKLQQITEARLDVASPTAWYLAGDPGQVDTIETAFLEGEEEVFIDSHESFEVDGVMVKARMDFAAKAIDHRPFFKNAGA